MISAAHESDPIATALRHLQRRVVALGREAGRERDGLAIARGIAMTSYLTTRHFDERLTGCDRNDSRLVEHRIGDRADETDPQRGLRVEALAGDEVAPRRTGSDLRERER